MKNNNDQFLVNDIHTGLAHPQTEEDFDQGRNAITSFSMLHKGMHSLYQCLRLFVIGKLTAEEVRGAIDQLDKLVEKGGPGHTWEEVHAPKIWEFRQSLKKKVNA